MNIFSHQQKKISGFRVKIVLLMTALIICQYSLNILLTGEKIISKLDSLSIQKMYRNLHNTMLISDTDFCFTEPTIVPINYNHKIQRLLIILSTENETTPQINVTKLSQSI